ncbi:hypothetical protein [Bradyrhizobium sp. BRP56]|uniref:hypothetical protein n=1 Tax=Bradyrhizobium sp. BRP56 TaxID=2793819 RepID=UPI001CD5D010|nr:hypothetical protein [Bradyrhizobium sp. BRP56]MCA1399357.1 hypothetical protein [Bradyrhizobium sp. BRP56]
MTDGPGSRETHIVRIFGTNRNGERLDHIWADVERIDVVKSKHKIPGTPWSQGLQRTMRWCDDPNGDDYSKDGTPSRIFETLKICDPENEDDVNDPEEWIPIKVVKGLRSRVEGTENGGGAAMDRFLSSVADNELTERVVEVRKIIHHDSNIDDAAQASFDAGHDAHVVQSEDYEKKTNNDDKDDEQYIEQEIITYLKHKGNTGDVSGIGGQTKLLNQYLIDESDLPKGKVAGQNGFNPPYRLDPFQNIVNVQFTPRVYVIIMASGFDYAVSNLENVKVIDKESQSFTSVPFAEPLAGTLIECSANAGKKFCTLRTTSLDNPIGPERVRILVCPKKDSVKENWFNYVQAMAQLDFLDDRFLPADPFLWYAQIRSVGKPTTINFNIRYKPHLTNPRPGVKNAMVQCYPTSGNNEWPSGIDDIIYVTTGWETIAYRVDKKGTDNVYGAPPAWKSDVVVTAGDTKIRGLTFGKDPPKIAADVTFTGLP